MSDDVSDRTALVVDGGLFLPFAQRLARDFKNVLYFCPGEKPFPLLNDAVLGDGFGGVTRVDDLWMAVEEMITPEDVIVFPDVGHADLALHLQQMGHAVWSSRYGDQLELDRVFLKNFQRSQGMAIPPYEVVHGLTALAEYLRQHEDVYVKLSKYRGVMETFHSVTYRLSEPWLAIMACKLGPLKDTVDFVVEDHIEAIAELGFDGFCIDGQFPEVAVQGIEAKDFGYIGCVRPFATLPKEIQGTIEPLLNFLTEQNYRNFFSTEVRVGEDGTPYLTDPCCRHASPAGECLDELYENLGEIIWLGARGILLEPVYTAKFAVQAMIDHPGDEDLWRLVDLPDDARQWTKLFFACEIEGKICLPPFPWSHSTIGSVLGIGDTLEEAIEDLKEHAELLGGQGLTIHTEAVVEVVKEIQKSEEAGVEVSPEPVPDPAEVMKEL